MAREDRPDVQIFMALLDSNLWRPSDSGRRVALDWLHSVARNTFSHSQEAEVHERREVFRAALALEDTENPKHPSQVGVFPSIEWSGHADQILAVESIIYDPIARLIFATRSYLFARRSFLVIEPLINSQMHSHSTQGVRLKVIYRFYWTGLARSTQKVSLCLPIMARQSAGFGDIRYYEAKRS